MSARTRDLAPAARAACTLGPWAALAVAVAAVYLRAASFPFVFDDQFSVVENPSLAALWPLSGPLSPPAYYPTAGRPLVNLSFAVNRAVGGLDPTGYRLVGLALHALSAGLLYTLMRRTLELMGAGRGADGAALVTSLLWALHPLQSEAVVYVTQRTELMMGCCFLATLCASQRHWDAKGPSARRVWLLLAVAAALAGMASKESMVFAPVAVLLYDRTFRSGSLGEAWRRSRPLYAGLFSSWLLLLLLNVSGPRIDTAGFHHDVSPVSWWITQTRVFWLYLRLVVWPSPLAIHYELPYLESVGAAAPWLLATAALAAATGLALWRNRPTGYAWTCVFGLLAPMWLVPIVTEVAAERRMYLPLAAILGWAVAGSHRLLHARSGEARFALDPKLAVAVSIALVLACGAASVRRLSVYRSPLALWSDTVETQPENALARNNLALALADAGRVEAAAQQLRTAIELSPEDAKLYFNLGHVLAPQRPDEAIGYFQEAIRRSPEFAEAYNDLGGALARTGNLEAALAAFERAVAIRPQDPAARANLETARRALGR